MNIEEQLEEFCSTLDYNSISANAIAVYTILLHIAIKTEWIEWFSVANSTLISKCNLTIKQLQTARNELITKNFINYKKGGNQNNAPRYSIVRLYKDRSIQIGQAEVTAGVTPQGRAGVTAEVTPQGYIITKLNLLFNYIINNCLEKFENVKKAEADAIMNTIKKLGLEININTISYFDDIQILDLEIQYWVIKELHYSPFKIYINKLTHDMFIHAYLKSKKYITTKDNYKIEEIINYFYKCITNEMEGS